MKYNDNYMKCKDKIISNQFEMSKIISISIDYN